MPTITFIDFSGEKRAVKAEAGESLMLAATQNDVPGIDADCGGTCACATCHCYIAYEWTEVVGGPNELEGEMLDVAEEVKKNSRLACQIEITDHLDGLVVSTPESQF